MKWKILLRFLAILILSVFIIMFINSFVAYRFLVVGNDQGNGVWNRLSAFTLDFKQYVLEEEGKPLVSQAGLAELALRQAWIQILDEEGYEVYQWNKPAVAPTHYTPSEMVYYNIYSGALVDYTTFAGTAKLNGYKWSYIIGYPMDKIAKYTFTFQPESLNITLFQIMLCMLVIPILVFILMGYVFGRSLTNPVIKIIEGIKRLAEGEYDVKYPEKGLYKEVYCSLNDLTARLKRSEGERAKTEKMREEWIQNLSHDLKTPLASIKGYGELLADQDYELSGQEIKEYAGIIKDKAEYLERLVEDLKLAQVLKGGFLPIKKEPGNLVELLRNVTVDVLNNPYYQGRLIHFNSRAELIPFNFDRNLMERAFANLIYNALVHSDEKTEIAINIYQDDQIRIEIVDNGRGISQEDLQLLFERYYRGTNTGEKHKGSGLGLNIAKQIIEVHEGTIEVTSSQGLGTKVKISFPKSAET